MIIVRKALLMTPDVQPTLTTPRLLLRPFAVEDAPQVERYASHREVAETTLCIPHPYPEGAALEFIRTVNAQWTEGGAAAFVITLLEGGEIIGGIDLRIEPLT